MKQYPADPSTFVDAVVSSRREFATCIADLIGYCRHHSPSPVWDELRTLDYRQDVARLTNWLSGVLTSEPPEADIQAFWFGLYTSPQERSVLYLAGSDYFDLEDHGWVRFPIYWPAGRRAPSPVLYQIHQSLRKAGGRVFSLGWYVLCLGYACLAVAEALKAIDPELLLGPREKRHVAVGFDGGDFVVLGWVDKGGWHAFEPAAAPPQQAPAEAAPKKPSALGRAARATGRIVWMLLRKLAHVLARWVLPFLGRLAQAAAAALLSLLRRAARAIATRVPALAELAGGGTSEAAMAVPAVGPPASLAGVAPATAEEEPEALPAGAQPVPPAPTEAVLRGEVSLPEGLRGATAAATMRAYAEQAVIVARDQFRVDLDYSEASLEQVEWILSQLCSGRAGSFWHRLPARVLGAATLGRLESLISRLRGREPPERRIEHMARLWGAYVGEVMRQRWHGTWAEEEPPPADTMVTLRVQRNALFPVGRVQARLSEGPEQSIWFYYRALKQRFEAG